MDIYEIRLINARELAKQVGGITKFSVRMKKSQGQISHIIGENPIKTIGSRIAREIEEEFSKPRGWMDQLHGISKIVNEEPGAYEPGGLMAAIIKNMNRLQEDNLKEVDIFVNYLLNRQAAKDNGRSAKTRAKL